MKVIYFSQFQKFAVAIDGNVLHIYGEKKANNAKPCLFGSESSGNGKIILYLELSFEIEQKSDRLTGLDGDGSLSLKNQNRSKNDRLIGLDGDGSLSLK